MAAFEPALESQVACAIQHRLGIDSSTLALNGLEDINDATDVGRGGIIGLDEVKGAQHRINV